MKHISLLALTVAGLLPLSSFSGKFIINGLYFEQIEDSYNVALVAPFLSLDESESPGEGEITPPEILTPEPYKGEVVIPSEVEYDGEKYTVTTVGNRAFAGCPELERVILPPTLEKIEDYAFYNCGLITDLEVPESVTSVGRNAFSNCQSLISIDLKGKISTIEDQTFYNCKALKNVILSEEVSNIKANALAGCWSLELLPEFTSLELLGDGAFLNCHSLTSFRLPETLVGLGNNVFEGCKSLEDFVWDAALEEVPSFTFADCESLRLFKLPESVKIIGEYAFSNCSSLDSVPLTYNITNVGRGAFSGCNGLTVIETDSEDLAIGDLAFSNCKELYYVVLRNVSELGNEVFAYDTALRTIAFDEKMTSIGSRAFGGCQSLKTVYAHRNIPPVITNTTFEKSAYDTVELIVKTGDGLLYKQTPPWSYFMNVTESDLPPSGVEGVIVEGIIQIEVENGRIIIKSEGGKVPTVSTLDGRLVTVQKTEGGYITDVLVGGIYLVGGVKVLI